MIAWLSLGKGRRPFMLEYRSANWFIIASVSIAVFTEIFLYGLVVPVLPFALTVRVGISEDDVQYWVSVLLSIYAVFLLAPSPFLGWIADKTTTRRLPLLVSLLSFGAATVLLMLGRSISVLIAGRALQGASAAAVWSIGLALLVDTVGHEEIGEAMGYVSLSMSLAVFCAPLLGGVVYERSGYYSVFYMAFGVIALDVILRFLIIEKTISKQWLDEGNPDTATQAQGIEKKKAEEQIKASATLAEGIGEEKQLIPTPLAGPSQNRKDSTSSHQGISPVQMPASPPTNTEPNAAVGANISTSTPSPANQPRHRAPIFTLLASRRLLAALWGTMVLSTINTSFDTVLPLRVATLFGWNSIGAGLIFLAVIVPSLINPLVGKLADSYGARLLTTFGFLLDCPLLVCLRFVDHDSIQQKVLLCALLALLGCALSASLVPLLVEITQAVEEKGRRRQEAFGVRGAYAQGYGLMNASYAVGTLIGPLWSGLVNDRAGWGTMTWSLGIFAGLSAIIVFLSLGGWIGKKGIWAEMRTLDKRKDKKAVPTGEQQV